MALPSGKGGDLALNSFSLPPIEVAAERNGADAEDDDDDPSPSPSPPPPPSLPPICKRDAIAPSSLG